jgi:hypothetical protein
MKQNKGFPVLILLGSVAVVALGVWFRTRQPVQNVSPSPNPLAAQSTNATPVNSTANPAAYHTNPAAPAESPVQQIAASFMSSPDARTARQLHAEFRATLASMPKNMAVAEIRRILESKQDGPTHLGFKVAGNGLLDEAPTLRTFLLDQLARLDAAAAAEYSKIILASMDSADEWAVALRNLARGDSSPGASALLEQKTIELLRHVEWQQNPSVGFLEAFDVAVYLGGTSLLPSLTDLVSRQDNPAIAHAAYLALDRLIINNPAATLSALQADMSLMQGREMTRANYFARADVRDPQQRLVLESYLLSPQIGAAELDAFAGRYPSANFMISNNLLTTSATPDHAALASRDAESQRVLDQWQADPRFANLRPELDKMKMRLAEFVRQAAAR